MKKTLLLIALMIGTFTLAQNRYTISGKIEGTSFHQGGAYQDYNPIPFVKPNFQLLLVRFIDGDSIPQIVKTITSDDEGNFSFKVAPGKYGFVGVNDSIVANQFLPASYYSSDDMFNSSSSSWEFSGLANQGPVVVSDHDIKGIIITNHQYSACGMCP